MSVPKQTWREKWLAKEENGSSCNSSYKQEVEATLARGDPNPGLGSVNPGSGNCNPEMGIYHLKSGNRNPGSGNSNQGKEDDPQREELVLMDVNMVFTILAEFRALTEDVAELALGAERAVFDKPENLGTHMKPLFIRGHLDGTSIGHMLMDRGASINILPLSLFQKLSHVEGNLKRTNLSLSDFAGDLTEAKGIIYKELTVGML
jgi:hypothetical protein